MTEFTRDSSDTAPAPQSSLRDRLVAQHGPAVAEALLEIELNARKKNAERLRDLRTQLAALNAEINAKLQAHGKGLVPFQVEMERCYQAWLAASEAYEAERCRADGLVAGLRGQATVLIKEISAPPAHFQRMVNQWSRPPDFVGPEEPREFENKTVVHVHPNWAPADPNHSSGPRETWNVPANGPGGRRG